MIPLKDKVRKAEGIDEDDVVTIGDQHRPLTSRIAP